MQREEGDVELMLLVQQDDAAAFAELMRRYRDRITGFFRGLSQDDGLSEDLFQETFIRLWSARKRYEPRARFSTYLLEIAKNLWLSERQRWKRRAELQSLDERDDDHPDVLSVIAADLREIPEEVLLRKERERQIRDAVNDLPLSLAAVFILSHSEGFKYREIAVMLGIAEGTVKWRMSQAVRKLREQLHDFQS